ncbi:hypothetical protein WJ63_15905 [Burkholderia pyrrocinia]|nr:hypothetical protein WJ63_15905 [Burkholderia pyrrocinia]
MNHRPNTYLSVDDDYGYWEPTPWGFGQAGSLDQSAAQRDVIAELHGVVAEVTGKPVTPSRPRIGFLP